MKSGQIKGGAIISYLGIIVNILTGIIYTPWILRTIGTSNYGLYTLAISLISIFVMDFGVSAAVTRYSSLYLAKGEKEKSNEVVALAYKLFLVIDVLIAVVLIAVYFFIPAIYRELTVVEIEKFKIVYVIVAIYNVIQFPFTNLNGILNAYEKFIQLKVGDLVNKLFVVITTVLALLCGGGLYELVTINAIGGLVTIAFKGAMVHKYTDCKPKFNSTSRTIKISEILGFSAWSTVISVASRCIFLLTPSILGAMSGTLSIAIFGFASTLENYVFLVANALNGLFLPKIARISVSNDRDSDLLQLMVKVGRIQIYIIGLIIVGFLVLGDIFIRIWLGSGYEVLFPCTVLLILPSYINLPQQIANTTMTVENHVKSQAIVFILMAIINVALSLLVSKKYGALGACVAIFIAYMFRVIAMNYLYNKKLHIDLVYFFKNSFLKIAPFQAVVVVAGYLMRVVIGTRFNEKVEFCLVGFGIVIIYAIICYLFSMSEEEKFVIKKIVRRR